MKKILLSVTFAILCFVLVAQNYQVASAERISHFSFNTASVIHTIKLDPLSNSDTLKLKNPPMIRQLLDSWNMFTTNGGSWLGKELMICPDGTNIILNKTNDSIRFNTQAGIGNIWEVYSKNGKVIEGAVLNVQYTSFLGISDSVKTIGFQVFDSLGNILPSALNNYQIKISKNFGFVRCLNFYEFPEYVAPYDDLYEVYPQMDIIGIEDNVGWQELKVNDIYSWEPGWEHHIFYVFNPGPQPYNHTQVTKKTIRRILEKSQGGQETTLFSVEICMRMKNYDMVTHDSDLFLTHDTILQTVVDNADNLLNKSSMEVGFGQWNNVTYLMKYQNRIVESGNLFYVTSGDTAGILIYDGGSIESWYPENGSLIYDWDMSGGSGQSSIVYYLKGLEEWGTPYYCDSLLYLSTTEIVQKQQTILYPNPVTDYLNVEANRKGFIQIFDMQGNIVIHKEIDRSVRIEVSHLSPGIYNLRYSNSVGVDNRRFIKQ